MEFTTKELAYLNQMIGIAPMSGNNYTMSNFRKKYRNIDVLLIDDIQFIIE